MKYIIEDTTLRSIADAIRDKNGESQQYTPEEMPGKIEEIQGGGSGGGGYTIEYRDGGVVGKEEKLLQDIENEVWIDGYQMFNGNNNFNYSQLNGKNMKLTNCGGMFKSVYSSGNNVDFSNFDTSKVLDFSYMFYNGKDIKNLDLTGINANNGVDFTSMFYYCENLKELKGINSWSPTCTSIKSMFSNLGSKSDVYFDIDLSNFAMTDVTADSAFRNGRFNKIIFPENGSLKGQYIFYDAKIKEELDLSGITLNGNITYLFWNTHLYNGLILPHIGGTSNPNIFNSGTYIYRMKFGEGNTFNYSGNITLNITQIWRGAKSTEIPEEFGGGTYEEAFLEFVDSLMINSTGYTKTIKLNTNLYNSLSDEQKALLTDKNYTLSYGTS